MIYTIFTNLHKDLHRKFAYINISPYLCSIKMRERVSVIQGKLQLNCEATNLYADMCSNCGNVEVF